MYFKFMAYISDLSWDYNGNGLGMVWEWFGNGLGMVWELILWANNAIKIRFFGIK